MRLTMLSKVILFIISILFVLFVIFFVNGILIITDNQKAVINNNELLLKNGWYWYQPFSITRLKNYPNKFNLFEKIELQISDGTIYYCEIIIKTNTDIEWVKKHRKTPTLDLSQYKYSLKSYLLNYTHNITKTDFLKPEMQITVEELIREWLLEHVQNSGIKIEKVKIYSPFHIHICRPQ